MPLSPRQIVGVPGAYPQPPIELPHLVWVLPSEWNGRSGDGGVISDTFPNASGCVGILPTRAGCRALSLNGVPLPLGLQPQLLQEPP